MLQPAVLSKCQRVLNLPSPIDTKPSVEAAASKAWVALATSVLDYQEAGAQCLEGTGWEPLCWTKYTITE